MRKLNIIIVISLIIIFLIHPIQSAFLLLGFTEKDWNTLAWIGVGLVLIHALIGIYLSADTLKTLWKGQKNYFQGNGRFWLSRISGFLILILMVFHFNAYGEMEDGKYVVFPFTDIKLFFQLGLLLALFIHLFVNVKPLLISLGITDRGKIRKLIFIILTLVLIFVSIAVLYYFFKWYSV